MPEKQKKLYRLPERGMIAGVAAGFAEYFNIDVTLMRAIFVILVFLTSGIAVIAYIVLAIIMPKPEDQGQPNDINTNVKSVVEDVRSNKRSENLANYFGLGLIIFGAWLLLGQLVPGWFDWQWKVIWPALIIAGGIWIVLRSKRND